MGWRLVPLVGLVLFVGVGFVWRTWLQTRRYGGTGIVLFRSGRRGQDLREALFLLLMALTFAQGIAAAVAPEWIAALGVLGPEAAARCRLLGAVLLCGATVLMAVAQLDLGASWRIGIEEGARPGLVTSGLYAICRNPIFLFMLLALAGFALLVPTWVSLAVLVAGVAATRRHVHEEEVYLEQTYGEAYRAYARRVGRFVPGLGRAP